MRIMARRGASLCALALLGSATLAHAQRFVPLVGRGLPQGKPRLVLFILPKGDPKKVAKDDPALALRDIVRQILTDTDKHEPVTFDPELAIIKRAVRERLIEPKDVMPPLSDEAMQRITLALGARRYLFINPTLTKTSLIGEVRFVELVGQQAWRTLLSEQITTGDAMGTRKFIQDGKPYSFRIGKKELATILADSVLIRIGVPSQLNEQLASALQNLGAKPKSPPPTPNKGKGKGETVKATPPPDEEGIKVADPPDKNTANAIKPKEPKTPPANVKPKPENTKPKPNEQGVTPNGANVAGAGADLANAQDALPLNAVKVDNEEQMRRYRQDGDWANVIVSLRRALNEQPTDTNLRQQLIQAYQERKQIDLALGEAERALFIQPADATLQRIYGNALLTKGDLPNAMKAFREAIRLDPKNILAQLALGDALLADNQHKEALSVYLDATKLDPNSPAPLRRIARAYLSRAAADPAFYTMSIEAALKARSLTTSNDSESYQEDYVAIMKLMESRFRSMLLEVQGGYQSFKTGKIEVNALNRALTDIKERAKNAEDYLDKLPPATGHEVTHVRYQQGAAFLSQAISLFRAFLQDSDGATETALRTAQLNANREMNAAAERFKPKPKAPAPKPDGM